MAAMRTPAEFAAIRKNEGADAELRARAFDGQLPAPEPRKPTSFSEQVSQIVDFLNNPDSEARRILDAVQVELSKVAGERARLQDERDAHDKNVAAAHAKLDQRLATIAMREEQLESDVRELENKKSEAKRIFCRCRGRGKMMAPPVKRFLLVVALVLGLAGPAAAQDSQVFSYKNITGDATTTIKSVPGYLHAITLNAPTATEVITLYDNSTSSGTKIGTITVPSSPQPVTLIYDVAFWTGLTIVTATATSDITVSFR
jgi:hypothetical protein